MSLPSPVNLFSFLSGLIYARRRELEVLLSVDDLDAPPVAAPDVCPEVIDNSAEWASGLHAGCLDCDGLQSIAFL